ncbi:PIG-L deacetylase family protein [Streptomyces sp. NPDC051554]|uniref:PIG-L deacetylase family protein n=1 Tax=Streptomyces sp. NPDC051554 TaxID=3365656 RepID=UPI00379EF45A
MSVLVIVAHPDDEVLGAGGTIAATTAAGKNVTVLIMAEGVSLRHQGVTLERARETCRGAARRLGVSDVRFGGFAVDGTLMGDGSQRAVVSLVADVLADVRPDTVLTHHPGDIHVDHRLLARSVVYATRVMAAGTVRRVLHFEVLSSTEQQTDTASAFLPTVYHDITGYIEVKCQALEEYHYEVFDAPHPRSAHGARALAAYRGTQVGTVAAEAFVLGREFVDASVWTGGVT